MHPFLGRILVLWLFFFKAGTSAVQNESPDDQQSSIPRFVLVEEHHHVISHIVRFSREGFLQSHDNENLPKEERSSNGAILIHIDSHADMGVPTGLNYLPSTKLFSNLPPKDTEEDIELLEHSVINDFLLLLGYMGIVEHIVFVEPPWSHLLKDAQYTTVDISLGVVPGDDGATYASIRNSPNTLFPNQQLNEDTMETLFHMMDDPDEPAYIVSHQKLLHHCQKNDECFVRTIRFTTLPYQGAADAIGSILDSKEDRERDIVLDIDLDGFSTTSPGALSLFYSAIPDNEVLTRIYHTVHDELCDMEKKYWEQMIETSGRTSNKNAQIDVCDGKSQSYVHGPSFQPTNKNPSARSFGFIQDLYLYDDIRDNRELVHTLAEVLEYFLPAIDASAYDDKKFVQLLEAFLLQPFYVPESETIEAVLDFHFDNLFRSVFEDRRAPKAINVVRSPCYTPDHHLDFIECEVFDRLLDMFVAESGSSPTLYHFEEVLVDRTNCLNEPDKFLPQNRFNIGTNENIDTNAWKDTKLTFTYYFEDDDDFLGRNYKSELIAVDFVNEHKHPLLVKTLHGSTTKVLPGQRLAEEIEHTTRWDLFPVNEKESDTTTNEPFMIIFMDGKKGNKQSFGSVSGRIPVHDMTPVQLEVENPSDSGILVSLKTQDEIEKLPPGETLTIHAVHGERWTIHGGVHAGMDEQMLGEIIANATFGEVHSVHLFSDESENGYEL